MGGGGEGIAADVRSGAPAVIDPRKFRDRGGDLAARDDQILDELLADFDVALILAEVAHLRGYRAPSPSPVPMIQILG